jgi:Zn-dependent M28 family amino/carboxypeptidase
MKKFLLIILFLSISFFTLAIASVTQPFVVRTTSVAPAVDSKALEAHVKKLSIALHPRSYTDENNLDATGNYIESELRAYGINSERQTYTVDGKAYYNIIARFGPVSQDVLVIGAHYDSHGITPGADDNASGVAGLLELARLLAKNPPKHTVELVAYTLEEPPFFRTENMGSAQHARALKLAGKNVRLMISIEMIGYFSDTPGSQQYPVDGMTLHYPDTGNFIALVGKYSDFASMRKVKSLASGATDLPIYSINAPPFLQGIDFSDHQSYWKHDFPAVMVTDTSFYRNVHYHEATDTAEKLDYARMAKVVQAVYGIAQGF